jgi:hypothetical protein
MNRGTELDELVDKVMMDHEMRRDRCESLPLKRRKPVRREANTSIIAYAAKRAIRERERRFGRAK